MESVDAHNTSNSMSAEERVPEPKIAVGWSLEPRIHSYSSDVSPILKLSLTNNGKRPITIYDENMNPSTILAEGQLVIYDHTVKSEVDQVKTRFCTFSPPSKVNVPLREQLFYPMLGRNVAPRAWHPPPKSSDIEYLH